MPSETIPEDVRELAKRADNAPHGTECVVVRMDDLIALADRASRATGAEPVAWKHEVSEPNGNRLTVYSKLQLNPWRHWVEEHRAQCDYVATPLYAAPQPEAEPVAYWWSEPVLNNKDGKPCGAIRRLGWGRVPGDVKNPHLLYAAPQPEANAELVERREINDEMEILQRLNDGDRIVFSQDGDMAWFSGGDRAFVGNAIMELRRKGYLKRECSDPENYRGLSEYDTISEIGRVAIAKHGGRS